ncbi:MAG TPA: NADH-quinone oxidoreductase subunit NuoE [Dissulfurispiraceae bacterium]|nr:NADH-quinone oxidoreductase subunit NuoE [Dissulfurispiraceae bacterium]
MKDAGEEHLMLSQKERTEIAEVLSHHEHRRAACFEALSIVQRHRGWVQDESLREIAELLGMTPDELDSVATFYNLIFRKPVGRHVILICDSVSCWVMGYRGLEEHLKARLGIDFGETTADGRFTLLPNACLGVCERAPAMMIDEDLHTDLHPEKIDQILEKYR